MTEFVGVITGKETKDGETNGKKWKRCVFTIGSEKISTFDESLIGSFEVGAVVKGEYTSDGKYKNLTSMEVTDAPPVQTATATDKSKYWEAKERRIVRQNCNHRATEALDLLLKFDFEEAKKFFEANGKSIATCVAVLSREIEKRVFE